MVIGDAPRVADHENTSPSRPARSCSPLTALSIGWMPATAFTMTVTVSTATATTPTRLAFITSQWMSLAALSDDRRAINCTPMTASGHEAALLSHEANGG